MKKLFFTLCALCVSVTMWGANATQDANRPETVYQDETSGLYFYVVEEEAVITSVNAWTADATTSSDFTSGYTINGTLTIPESVSYDGQSYNVTKIGASAFAGDTTIQGEFTLPAYINTVGASAFSGCTGITSVIIEYSATELLDENTAAYYSMFYGSNYITKVELDRDITISYNGNSVVGGAFAYHYRIAEIEIGANVTEIPAYMFRSYFSSNSSPLVKVTSYAENPPAIGNGAFSNANPAIELYTEYDYVNTYRLDSDWYAVFGNEIHSLTGEDPDWPTDELAFIYNGLWYDPIFDEEGNETGNCVLIADQGGEVYTGEITIPETATNSETGVSYTVTRIDTDAFDNSKIEGEVVIPANIINMGQRAFANCTGIKSVTYEYSSTALNEENNTSMSDGSFMGCSGVTTVNLYRDINYLAGATGQYGPFRGVTSITTVNVGPRVTYIPSYMFRPASGTNNINTINVYNVNPPELGSAPFDNLPSGYVINVPHGLTSTYSEATGWSLYTNYAELSNAFAITTHENDEGTAYATFYNGAANVELFDGELIAYEATTLEDEGLVIDIVEIGNVIPKATGVVVETAEAGTYLAIATENEDGSASTNNHLYGFDTAQECSQGEGYLYYLLSSYEGVVGFYWGATDGAAFECQAHRAYLALEQGSGSQGISIRKGSGEDTTGISSVESATEGASVKGIYTIQGVRVSNMNQPGLYIVDGKKVLVK